MVKIPAFSKALIVRNPTASSETGLESFSSCMGFASAMFASFPGT
jgi:hypothetical protein